MPDFLQDALSGLSAFDGVHHDWVQVLGGLLLLFVGGEGLVRGAVALAQKLKLSNLIIGLTVVGFGTSLPELLVSLQAAHTGHPDIAIGNVVGSNIANALLILGAGALIAPVAIKGWGVRRDALAVVAAAIGLMWLAFTYGAISREAGLIMVLALLAYLVITYLMERKADTTIEAKSSQMPILLSALWIVLGLGMLILGADLLVRGASTMAKNAGVSDAVIGLTLVAVGTSLPELSVSIVSAVKRQGDIALGNVLGSSLFNILGILGIAAITQPLMITSDMTHISIPIMVGVAVSLGCLVLLTQRIGRVVASMAILSYCLYVAWIVSLG
jgi:cation:H+ antiporter